MLSERCAHRANGDLVPLSAVSAGHRHWEPVSGFEPLTVRLQGRSSFMMNCRDAGRAGLLVVLMLRARGPSGGAIATAIVSDYCRNRQPPSNVKSA